MRVDLGDGTPSAFTLISVQIAPSYGDQTTLTVVNFFGKTPFCASCAMWRRGNHSKYPILLCRDSQFVGIGT